MAGEARSDHKTQEEVSAEGVEVRRTIDAEEQGGPMPAAREAIQGEPTIPPLGPEEPGVEKK